MQLYHNPRCSKSRQALALLQDRGVDCEVIEYLNTPPDAATLALLHTALDADIRSMIRFKEDEARELGLRPGDDRPRDEWLELLAAHPRLLERPLAIRGDRAVIGRPPEAILNLLD
ncbi:MAG: arsenate reductase (glutaredoxin) [Oceanococcaceae bacterium]